MPRILYLPELSVWPFSAARQALYLQSRPGDPIFCRRTAISRSVMTEMSKPDLDNKENIERFIDAFYSRVLRDERLAPIFLDVADIDLDVHLPHIRSFWEKLLLGERDYKRHTMNIHRQLHAKQPLDPADFERWLALFCDTADAGFSGPGTERAKEIARHIASNMERALVGDTPQNAG